MAYRELPQPAPHVACLWTRDPEPEPQTHRILPDACADVVWIDGRGLMVVGPATGPALSDIPAGTEVAGVRFRVGAAGAALRLPASELLDESVPLSELWGSDAVRIEDAVAAADDRLQTLAAGAARPGAQVDQLGDELGITDRQLRRRFGAAVGYGPKTLQRVLRFQRFLALASEGSHDLARLALDAGYADQAHLTRECRRLSGVTPAALLATGAAPAGEPSVPRV